MRTGIRRTLKALGILGAVPVVLAVLALALLYVRTARVALLRTTIVRADTALPGALTVARADWPSPGAVHLESVLWVDGPDTLVSAEEIRVSAALAELLKRDIHARELAVKGLHLDIPAISRRFAREDDAARGPETGDDEADEQGWFLKTGALPGVPSIAADEVSLDAGLVRITDGFELRGVRLDIAADLRTGSPPIVELRELSIARAGTDMSIDSLHLHIDLSGPSAEGGGVMVLPWNTRAVFACSSTGDGSFEVLLSRTGERPPWSVGIAVAGTAEIADRRIEAIELEAEFMTPGTEELAQYPFLAKRLEGVGPLEGVRGTAGGRLVLVPVFSAEYSLDLMRTTWIDTLHLAGAYGDSTITIGTLDLEMDGLAVAASGSRGPAVTDAVASVRCDGTGWLGRLVPLLSVPEDASARLFARARYDSLSGDTDIRLRGGGAAGGVSIDTLDVSGIVPSGRDRPVAADLLIGTRGATVVASASADLSSGIDLTLSHPEQPPRTDSAILLEGRLRAGGDTRGVVIDGLRASGAVGRVEIEARIDTLGGGTFEISGEWPAPPPLLSKAAAASVSGWDSIGALWERDGPFSVAASGVLSRSAGGTAVSARGAAVLPGPRVFAPLMGAGGGAVGDLGPVDALFSGTFATESGAIAYTGRFDLSPTAWLDTMIVSISGDRDTVSVDTVTVLFEGLRLSAGGDLAGERLDLAASLSLADSQLVGRLGRLAGREISLAANGMLDIGGTIGEPRVSADLGGRFSTGGLSIPAFTGTAVAAAGDVRTELFAPEGLSAGAVSFDSVRVSYEDAAGDSAAQRTARVEGTGTGTRLLLAVRMPRGGPFTVLADTLHASISGQTLSTRRPFSVSTLDGGGLRVDGVDMAGSIGRISADGVVSPDSSDLAARIAVVLPPKPASIKLAERLWPDSVTIDARAEGVSRLTARGRVIGVTLGDGTETGVSFSLESDRRAAAASLSIAGPTRTLLSMQGSFPPVGLGPSIPDGPIALDMVFEGIPLPRSVDAFFSESPDRLGRLSGRVSARGTLSDPEAVLDLRFRFLGSASIEAYALSLRGQCSNGGIRDTTLVRIAGEMRRRDGAAAGDLPELSAGGLSAGLILAKSDRPVLTGSLSYPLRISLKPPSAARLVSEDMSFMFESRELSLNDFDYLLPSDVDLEGFCELGMKAAGPASNPKLDGRFRTRAMRFSFARNLSASPSIDLALDGALERPSIKGTISIEQGQLRIPEIKSDLHPVKGDAALWEAADSFFTAADSAGATDARRERAATEKDEFMRQLELDVSVVIPSTFRVQSERLNLELEGNLSIRQKDGRPVITGELEPQQGRLLFMGRFFQIQRGSVFFYGEDELNPSFDLTMTARVGETDISIRLTGTAIRPDIELTSDPQMSESDIMSLLLFGRSSNDLDGAQSNLLQQRTAEALMAYGAARIEGEMSSRFGVDMFTFQQSTRDPNYSALTVGKYLNRRTMLKYEQGLESTAGFLINLEYYVTQQLKFETFIDQDSETGIEINWSKDY